MTIEVDRDAYIEQVDRWLCAECGEYSETTAEAPLYECVSCGEIFNRNNSYNSNHQCPSCMKMAGKLAKDSCSECEAGEVEEVQVWLCMLCDTVYETEDEAWDCCRTAVCKGCHEIYHDGDAAEECAADDLRVAAGA